jgi:hypothetical protein
VDAKSFPKGNRTMPNRRELVEAIAEALRPVSANQLPAVCTRLGLREGTVDEAMSSKRTYVRTRLEGLPDADVVAFGSRVMVERPTLTLKKTLDLLTSDAQHSITALTRDALLDELFLMGPLEGERELIEFLKRTWPLDEMKSTDARSSNASGDIWQHMVNNDDWAWSYLYRDYLGVMGLSDGEFLHFLEQVVHPIVRKGDAQGRYVDVINRHLAADGYRLTIAKHVSGYPEFRASRVRGGVEKPVKNIIFAANGPKPEIVLDDAVSNDIRIVKNEEFCLVYDRPISPAGLYWKDLVTWWAEHTGCSDEGSTPRALYERLRDSVPAGPERMVFSTYYQEFKGLGDELPVLIPQVYLHYDPYTLRELGGNKRLPRQRMDFLLLMRDLRRVVLEIDGVQHYAEGERASPARYAEMVAEDRRLKLAGYEVYRFGGAEFAQPSDAVKQMIRSFFVALLGAAPASRIS